MNIADASTVSIPNEYALQFHAASETIISIATNGRIFWRGREVETDDDFRAAMIELADVMTKSYHNA